MSRKEPRRKGRLLIWAAIAGLVALAILYWRCGGGFGIGAGDSVGRGKGVGDVAKVVDAGPTTCKLRLSSVGITVDGRKVTEAEAVAACKAAGAAEIVVTGDAKQGEWESLRGALDEAGVRKSLTEP
jgi:hypothetical protein